MHKYISYSVFMAFIVCSSQASAQSVDDLRVVLSCPEYEAGPPIQGNDPVVGARVQPGVLAYQRGDRVECVIDYVYTGSQVLNQVEFALQFPDLTYEVLVTDPQDFPGGNPLDLSYGRAGVYTEPDALIMSVGDVSGYRVGVFEPVSQRYSWGFGDMWPGSVGQLRVSLLMDATSYDLAQIELDVSATQGSKSPRVVRVSYAGGDDRYALNSQVVERAAIVGGHLGAHHKLERQEQGRRLRDMKAQVFLPYWDGMTIRADGAYDVNNADHQTLYDASQLRVWLVASDRVLAELDAGATSAPLAGANAGKIILHNTQGGVIEVFMGSVEEGAYILWDAPLVVPAGVDLGEGDTIPHTMCWSWGVHPATCSDPSLVTTLGVESTPAWSVDYQGRSYTAQGVIATHGMSEARALSATSSDFTQFIKIINPTSRALEQLVVSTQAPGDQAPQSTFVRASLGQFWLALSHLTGPVEIYVSTSPSSYGHELDLVSREVPQTQAQDWIRCNDVQGLPTEYCALPHLQAVGVDPQSVQEVSFRFPQFPALFMAGLSTQSSSFTGVSVDWAMLSSVVDSINGTTSYDPNTLSQRSIASTSALSWDAAPLMRLPKSAEVSKADVDSLVGLTGLGAHQWVESSQPVVKSPGTSSFVGLRLYNDGVQSNIFGPFEVGLTVPPSFDIDSSQFFASDTMMPRLRVGRNDGAGTTLWSMHGGQYTTLAYNWEPASRQYTVQIETTHPDGALVPRAGSVSGVSDLILLLDGRLLVSAGDSLAFSSAYVEASVIESGRLVRKRFPLATAEFSLSPRFARPSLEVSAPDKVGAHQVFSYDVDIHNVAYDEFGRLLLEPSSLAANNAVYYQRITRFADHSPGGATGGNSIFVSASSLESTAIWVSVEENPPRVASDQFAGVAGGWTLCASPGSVCNSTKLAQANVSDSDVRWVAFQFTAPLELTDVEPRGVEARRGVQRQNVPYEVEISVQEHGSAQDSVVRVQGELVTSEQTRVSDFADTLVDASCVTSLPFVGFDEQERCDGVDNDCDGQIDEDFFTGLGCVKDFGTCSLAGQLICDAQGFQVCDTSMHQDQDQDTFPDLCDCAPEDGMRSVMDAFSLTSCDYDGDGECDRQIAVLNQSLCTQGVGDCNDLNPLIYSQVEELCDDVDNNCNGQIDESYLMLGDTCAVGQGACYREGTLFCGGDARSVTCDAIAGSPVQELCDGFDNDCDGEVDEDFTMLGSPCVEGVGACARDGVFECDSVSGSVVCSAEAGASSAERCDGIDNDCDGDIDEDFALSDACDVVLFEGCAVSGFRVCAVNGEGYVCMPLGSPSDMDADGYPDECDCAPEDATRRGVEDCDGDLDGWCDAEIDSVNEGICKKIGDCDDANADVHPGADELCDGVDNNCDAMIDEGFDVGSTCRVSMCEQSGVLRCSSDGTATECTPRDMVERCDGVDNNCNGEVDEGFDLGSRCVVGEGECAREGVLMCDAWGSETECVTDVVEEREEECNGLDDDCDGEVDEGLEDCDIKVIEEDEEPEDEVDRPRSYAVYGTGFCATGSGHKNSGGGYGYLIALIGFVGLLRMKRRGLFAMVLVLWCGVVSDVHAQDGFVLDSGVSTQQFNPTYSGARGSSGSTSAADVLDPSTFSVGVWTYYGYRPVVLEDRDTGEQWDLITHQVQGELSLSFGLFKGVELGASLPVLLLQRGDLSEVGSRGVGDARVGLRYGSRTERFGWSGGLSLGVPVGSETALQSNSTWSIEPYVVGSLYGARGSVLSVNLGYLWRPQGAVFLNAERGKVINWSLGGVYPVRKRDASWLTDIEVFSELYGDVSLVSGTFVSRNMANYPAEVQGGVRFWFAREHMLSVSGGPGLTRGYGTPTARAIAGYRYVPAREDEALSRAYADKDGDGVRDEDDQCLDEVEDLDGFEDEDGCPDPDNDRDEILDFADGCPLDPEDRDTFEDEDGCPDRDNDRDGVLDTEDQCMFVPEDLDGFEDGDGCPEADNDLDGYLDNEDQCPDEPEDFDGFEDEDGCPDEDNDEDGILDVNDACPLDQEVINDFEDEDGCPDDVDGDLIAWTTQRILVKEEIYFDTDRAKIQDRSRALLRQVAEFLLEHPEIEIIEIQGHTDEKGSHEWNMDLSWRRAENVRRYLIKRGVDPGRIVLSAYGKVRPLKPAGEDTARARNRRVEFRIRRLKK